MSTGSLIAASDFCEQHHIGISFLQSLHDYGLLEITWMETNAFIPEDQLPQAEQYIRWHYELDINLAGIDAITHMLQRVETMQEEIRVLRNRLRRYDAFDK
jgi:hypothetical protein